MVQNKWIPKKLNYEKRKKKKKGGKREGGSILHPYLKSRRALRQKSFKPILNSIVWLNLLFYFVILFMDAESHDNSTLIITFFAFSLLGLKVNKEAQMS